MIEVRGYGDLWTVWYEDERALPMPVGVYRHGRHVATLEPNGVQCDCKQCAHDRMVRAYKRQPEPDKFMRSYFGPGLKNEAIEYAYWLGNGQEVRVVNLQPPKPRKPRRVRSKADEWRATPNRIRLLPPRRRRKKVEP